MVRAIVAEPRDKRFPLSRGARRGTREIEFYSTAFSRPLHAKWVVSLSKHGVLGILIDLGLVLDVFSAIRIPTHTQSTRRNDHVLYRSTDVYLPYTFR